MRKTTPTTATAPDSRAITLSLTEAQLKALGLHQPPAPGAEVQLRATAKVTSPAKADRASDTDHDGDQDAGDDAQDGDTDANGAADNGTARAGTPDDSTALTLHLTGLTLTQAQKTPDKVLYGSGD